MSLKDRLRLKLKANFLMYGYNAGPPMGISIYTVLPYCAIVRTDNHQFFLREEKGLTEKLCAYALDRKKTCSHANLLLRLLSYASSRRRICEIIFTCTSYLILHFHPIICMQLPFYTFSTSMSLEDRLRLKLKVKTNISLCMPIMLDHPCQSLHTQYTANNVILLHSRERDRYKNLSAVLKLLAIHRATTKLQLCICNVYSANTGVVQVYSIVYTLFTLLIHVQPYTVVSQF